MFDSDGLAITHILSQTAKRHGRTCVGNNPPPQFKQGDETFRASCIGRLVPLRCSIVAHSRTGITAALLWCTKWWDGRAHVTRAPREPCEADALAVRYGELRPNVWMHGVFATRTLAPHTHVADWGGVALVLPNDAAFARLQLVARVREYALHYYVDGGAREVIIGPRFFACNGSVVGDDPGVTMAFSNEPSPDVVARWDDAAAAVRRTRARRGASNNLCLVQFPGRLTPPFTRCAGSARARR